MEKFLIIIGTMIFSFVMLAFGSFIGAFFFWLIWNTTIADVFPRAIPTLPAYITLWQSFKLMYLLGTVGRFLRPDVKVEKN